MAHLIRVTLLTAKDKPLRQYETTAVPALVGWRIFERLCDVLKALVAEEMRRTEGAP